MLRRHWTASRPGNRVLPLLIICAVLLTAAPVRAAWRVMLGDADLTTAGAPVDSRGIPLIEVLANAPALGIRAEVNGPVLTVTDPSGEEFSVAHGSLSLTSQSRTIPLPAAAIVANGMAFLPLETVAGLAGLAATIDPAAQSAVLSRAAACLGIPFVVPEASAEGWLAFTLPKETDAAKGQSFAEDNERMVHIKGPSLPPLHQSLRVGLGLGYVQGQNMGLELTAQGRLRGRNLSFGTLLTQGANGFELTNGRVSLLDDEFGWSAEAGRLFTDLRGSANGLRYSWRAGEKRWPSLSLYIKDSSAGYSTTALAYRDEFSFGKNLLLGGEFGSDGSAMLKGSFQIAGLRACFYSRSMPGPDDGMGAYASYSLGRGFSIFGGVSSSGSGDDRIDLRTLSLRVPVRSGIDLYLERLWSDSRGTTQNVDSATVSLPVGRLRLMTRFESRDTSFLRAAVPYWDVNESRQLTTSAFFLADPRLSFDYRVCNRWRENTGADAWEELLSTYRLSNRTQIQLTSAFPSLADPDRLNIRIRHVLRDNLALTLDYGRLSSYQGRGSGPGERGFTFMVRCGWNLGTPTRGGRIAGRVTDQLGKPLTGAIVKVGSYRARTNSEGSYEVANLPPASYDVNLDEASIPANYKNRARPQRVAIDSRTRETIDFSLLPLHSVGGVVYLDHDNDSCFSQGEGVPAAVVYLDGFPTATDDKGNFAFFNVEPGKHLVKLDSARLPAGCSISGLEEMVVDLTPNEPVTGLEFQVARHDKPVIYQALR